MNFVDVKVERTSGEKGGGRCSEICKNAIRLPEGKGKILASEYIEKKLLWV